MGSCLTNRRTVSKMKASPTLLLLFVAAAYSIPLGEKCPKVCPNIYLPVCGTDGKTYANDCNLRMASGCWNEDVKKLHDGPCREKRQAAPCMVACPYIYFPVCGSDGKTYPNKCALGAAVKCENKPDLKVAHTGEC